jgi:hypothetical protein
MPPIAQRLREPAAFVLLAFGALSTLFNTITFLFNPGGNNGLGGGPTFSQRAHDEVGNLLSVVVVAAVVGAVYLAHWPAHLKQAKALTLASLVTLGVADLFGVVALFSAFGADGATGWDKTTTFFVSLGELGIAGVGTWLVLGYFQQHQPAAPAGERFQQPQWGPGPGPQQPPQQWQQPPVPQQQPQGQQQPWGPPPQQAPQPTGPQPPQPQWGQPQPQQQDADAMMTQAIPTVPPAQQGQHGQHGQQQPPQPPQQDGGLPIGNWTAE